MTDIPARLNVVSIAVRDVQSLKAFYQRLGWETNSTGDDFAAFPLGGAVLGLYDVEAFVEEVGLERGEVPAGSFKGFTCAINVEEIDQVDTAIAAARDAGATVLAEPVTREWGGRSGYFTDPEGNVWEVAWLPNAAFDERGGLIWPF